jgi:hypothetical protein
MKPPTEKQATSEIIDLLAELFDSPPKAIRLREPGALKPFDYSISLPGHCFLVEYKSSASAGQISLAVDQLKRHAEAVPGQGQPLMVVPFMGPVGRDICAKAGMAWLDLSGNARIVAPGLRIRIEGRPNKYLGRGRPPNVFAPKSSRIARELLREPRRFQTQAELVRQTELDDGYVSKIVRRLDQEHFLEVNDAGAVRPRDPDLLLEAWHGVYDFGRHRVLKGHVPARTGEELLQRLAEQFSREGLEYAATGLGAAWLFTHFAAFRLATFYLPSMPARALLKEMEFSDEPRGANLWLAIPDDDGVFQGSQNQAGIRCVSPVQTYLDLKGQQERAKEAAVEFRRQFLSWGAHGT